jgi:hypothetical protein
LQQSLEMPARLVQLVHVQIQQREGIEQIRVIGHPEQQRFILQTRLGIAVGVQ